MIILDVNVVLALHREDHPHHPDVKAWFAQLEADDVRFGVPAPVWASFVRISTSRRVFAVPTPLSDAFTFVHAVRAQPGHVAVVAGARHLELFERLCHLAEAAGDLAADAYVAAFAVEQGCELASLDRDFARFPGLRWRRPGPES